ncbi:MAG TPA: hypothetical protein VKY65_08440 [Alphaproteobacteria bacterium]|nr:hypothetical protein [Alphaproteobacteria bacterium]
MQALRKWVITFVISCTLCCAGVLFALWAMNDFQGLGLGVAGTSALVLGIIFSVALGVGLMGLVFASDRSAKDEEVHHLNTRSRE